MKYLHKLHVVESKQSDRNKKANQLSTRYPCEVNLQEGFSTADERSQSHSVFDIRKENEFVNRKPSFAPQRHTCLQKGKELVQTVCGQGKEKLDCSTAI